MSNNPPGKKRPILRGPKGRMTPVPWVAGKGPANGAWSYVDESRAMDAQYNHLCLVCGKDRGDDWVYALLFGEPYDSISNEMERIFGQGSPSPTYGHPECILMAALYCPHLKNQVYPAMTQDKREKLTVEDLKKLAKDKKTLKKTGHTAFAIGSASGKGNVTGDGRRAKVLS